MESTFDMKKFDKAKFTPREKTVEVTSLALADFFPAGSDKVFVVRGLTGEELSRCTNAQRRIENIRSVLEAVFSPDSREKVPAIRELFSLGGDAIEEDYARRLEMMVAGCVSPVMDIQTAAKVAKVAPVDAKNLTDNILLLSGQGMIPGGQKASGEKTKSEPLATSAMPGAECCTS
jgi:hypothetical protein